MDRRGADHRDRYCVFLDDDFRALADAIQQAEEVAGGFGFGDVDGCHERMIPRTEAAPLGVAIRFELRKAAG